jgi:hypothetical protein
MAGPLGFAAFLLAATPAARDRISFDFGWRHRPGLHAGPVPLRPPPNPDPGPSPAEAAPDFDDSEWARVQLPHDGIIGGSVPSRLACPHGCSGRSYLPRYLLWYRKTFRLPDDWRGSAVWLDFDGAFRRSTVWLNGALVASHDCGYTPFRVRLDNASSIGYGPKAHNVVAVFVRSQPGPHRCPPAPFLFLFRAREKTSKASSNGYGPGAPNVVAVFVRLLPAPTAGSTVTSGPLAYTTPVPSFLSPPPLLFLTASTFSYPLG